MFWAINWWALLIYTCFCCSRCSCVWRMSKLRPLVYLVIDMHVLVHNAKSGALRGWLSYWLTSKTGQLVQQHGHLIFIRLS